MGADGLEVRWLWVRRFLRYEEIDDVQRFEPFPRLAGSDVLGLRIVPRSGEEVLLPVAVKGWGRATLMLIEERIGEASRRSRRSDAEGAAAMLRRGDRGVRAWITTLRSLGAGANAGPRTALVPRERLFRVVEDAEAEATARASRSADAGIAILPTADEIVPSSTPCALSSGASLG